MRKCVRRSALSNHHLLMDRQQPRRRNPEFQFRVLIIGRANAGKTTILQRVRETTESPIIYRRRLGAKEREEVSGTTFCLLSDLTADQVQLDPTLEVSDNSSPFSSAFPLTIELPARRAHNRRRACVLQLPRLRFSRLSRNRAW